MTADPEPGIQGTYAFMMTSLSSTAEAFEVPTILGAGGFASLITFKDGSGPAAGTLGQIRLRGELDQVAATTAGDYIGTIVYTVTADRSVREATVGR